MKETCSFYLRSKCRNCKFERAPNSIYCHLHNDLLEYKSNDCLKSLKVPCFIDGRHLVSIDKIRTHIKKCSRIRDIAYESSQPFYFHNGRPPKQLSKLCEKISRIKNDDFTLNIDTPEKNKDKNNSGISKDKLNYIELVHLQCEERFGKNPHFITNIEDNDFENLNRDEIQAINIAKESKKRFKLCEEPNIIEYGNSLIVEFGAGNAILTYWFVKEMSNEKQIKSGDKMRCVIIDRESRRKQLEKAHSSISPLRLRLDIELFDFGSLLSICNNKDETEFTAKKSMYFGSDSVKNIPWIITSLIESGVWIFDSNSNVIKSRCEAEKLCTEEIRYILDNLSNGGGPNISKIEETILKNFIARPIKDVFIISKHLCGSGFDLGLKVPFESKNKMNKPSKLRIIMSPCCHHKCTLDQHCGLELLESMEIYKEYFKNFEDCFKFIITISSWATGANDWKSDFGFKAKYILDSCRYVEILS
ncbi:hypothetical protein FG386_002963 [Cryptosporidium ryanae]|uniref:uncharacterized protein n=1 Tax=Cryptosporidium ryanae TaxID=515981 RepID=UPI00351A46ED|nr:hypothetical protein FG386_002963 [Cryptosporidium ryanae]